ncbi:MAG: pyridoxamine 5'-phosphate oxidase family protein [Waterburya sp.]
MAKFYSQLTEELQTFISAQQIFFTATAPIKGRINLSPKGIDTFRCLNPVTVGYLDLTGSGNETSAHLQENGRMTIMFCSFTEKPLILRLYGTGKVIKQQDKKWQELSLLFPSVPGERQIILLQIESVQTSCGYGVPIYELQEQRQNLIDWAKHKGKEGVKKYWQENNQQSIDGLPINIPSEKRK